MTKVTVDSETLAKLYGLSDVLELCDESGQTLGFFRPVGAEPGIRLADRSPFSAEQIEVFRQQRTGRPLAEILSDLEKRA